MFCVQKIDFCLPNFVVLYTVRNCDIGWTCVPGWLVIFVQDNDGDGDDDHNV